MIKSLTNIGFSLLEVILAVVLSILFGAFGLYFLSLQDTEKVFSGLRFLGAFPLGLIVFTLQLRSNLVSISNESLNIDERRRINEKILVHSNTITKIVFVFLTSALLLLSSPLISLSISMQKPVLVFSCALLGYSVVLFVSVLLAQQEIEEFKLNANQRAAEKKEIERQLSKLE